MYYFQVPDPLNPEFSLAESWPDFHQDSHAANQNAANMYGVNEYSLSHELGISSISIQSLPVRDFKVLKYFLFDAINNTWAYELKWNYVIENFVINVVPGPISDFFCIIAAVRQNSVVYF